MRNGNKLLDNIVVYITGFFTVASFIIQIILVFGVELGPNFFNLSGLTSNIKLYLIIWLLTVIFGVLTLNFGIIKAIEYFKENRKKTDKKIKQIKIIIIVLLIIFLIIILLTSYFSIKLVNNDITLRGYIGNVTINLKNKYDFENYENKHIGWKDIPEITQSEKKSTIRELNISKERSYSGNKSLKLLGETEPYNYGDEYLGIVLYNYDLDRLELLSSVKVITAKIYIPQQNEYKENIFKGHILIYKEDTHLQIGGRDVVLNQNTWNSVSLVVDSFFNLFDTNDEYVQGFNGLGDNITVKITVMSNLYYNGPIYFDDIYFYE